jgi:hypothetical protein
MNHMVEMTKAYASERALLRMTEKAPISTRLFLMTTKDPTPESATGRQSPLAIPRNLDGIRAILSAMTAAAMAIEMTTAEETAIEAVDVMIMIAVIEVVMTVIEVVMTVIEAVMTVIEAVMTVIEAVRAVIDVIRTAETEDEMSMMEQEIVVAAHPIDETEHKKIETDTASERSAKPPNVLTKRRPDVAALPLHERIQSVC